ncbi:hypothetical protein JOM56_012121 [Amanita muscaria]
MNPIENVRMAFQELGERVDRAMRVQRGDHARLYAQRDEVRLLLQDFERMRGLFSLHDAITFRQSTANMIAALEDAAIEARDEMVTAPRPLARLTTAGHRGRWRLEIDRNWLAYMSQVQPLRAIADELGCHPRTVRRRQLEYGLAKHAPPVIQYVQHQDGTQTKEWHPTGPSMSDLNRDPQALDGVVGEILEAYPDYGIEYLRGAVRSKGHRISREHIRDSYHRVMGIRSRFLHRNSGLDLRSESKSRKKTSDLDWPGPWTVYPVERRVYSVPSVNSLWHHDGYHSKLLC